MSCDFAHHDGAYVVGALSPAERLGFEQHLTSCSDCAAGVRELAGLPGLLARVDPVVLESPSGEEPLPDSLLPGLVAEVRRTERRRLLAVVGAAAAAVVAAVLVPLTISDPASDTDPPGGPSPATSAGPAPVGLEMAPVRETPIRANVVLEQVAWGTRLDLTCTYETVETEYPMPNEVTYVLIVRTRDGNVEQVGTWRAVKGSTMHLTAGTSASRADIASIEVRATTGEPILTLTA